MLFLKPTPTNVIVTANISPGERIIGKLNCPEDVLNLPYSFITILSWDKSVKLTHSQKQMIKDIFQLNILEKMFYSDIVNEVMEILSDSDTIEEVLERLPTSILTFKKIGDGIVIEINTKHYNYSHAESNHAFVTTFPIMDDYLSGKLIEMEDNKFK